MGRRREDGGSPEAAGRSEVTVRPTEVTIPPEETVAATRRFLHCLHRTIFITTAAAILVGEIGRAHV